MEYYVDAETIEFLWTALIDKPIRRQSQRSRHYFEKFIITNGPPG
jgi:hypothetical protein